MVERGGAAGGGSVGTVARGGAAGDGVEQGAVKLRAPVVITAWGAAVVEWKTMMARRLRSVAWSGGTRERRWWS